MNIYPHHKVLVTGGAGFIGSHLVDALLAQQCHVVVLDNFSTGLHNNLRNDTPRLTVIEGSIVDNTIFRTGLDGVSCIFHLAAHISVPLSIKNPVECYETNIKGTYNVLEAARIHDIKHVVFSSSAAVYGAHEGPCHEEKTPCAPLSPYGTSKWIGELLCKDYGRLYGIRSACLRYFNVYGNRQRTDLPHAPFVAYLMHNMKRNEPIIIYGDGYQERDFVPVEQVVAANIRAGSVLLNNNWHGEAINIASGTSQSLRSFIGQLHQQFPDYDPANITFTQERPGDVKYSAAYLAKYYNFLQKQ
jgi:UDP-glucose 4-epimerase